MKRSIVLRWLTVLCLMVLLCPVMIAGAEENVCHESDENNGLENADTLETGVMMVGRLTDRDDFDYFKLETTSTGDIQINFKHEGDGIYAYYWYMNVLDSEQNILKHGTLSGRDPTDLTISTVKPGTYYIVISAISGGNPLTNGFTDAPYMLTVTTKCLSHPGLTDWVVTKEYSCSQDGERTRFCVECNTAVVVEPVQKLAHTYTEWSIIEEAGYFKFGEKQKVCTACGEVVKEEYMTDLTLATIIGGAALLVILWIIRKVRRRKRSAGSYSSYSSGSSRSSGGSSGGSYSGDSYSGGSYSGDSYSGDSYSESGSYGGSSSLDDYYTRPADGVVHIGGESHNVYRSDAEGYSCNPYIEDAEGYKTYVDPATVEPPFNWCDL